MLHILLGTRLPDLSTLQFIYISEAEMRAVADFIQRKGRVTVAELAAKSNTFIDLEEKAPDIDLECLDLDMVTLNEASAM